MRADQGISDPGQIEQELRESEARYRALAEGSPLAIFVNRDDTVFLANPACLKLFGASSPDELLGKPALELFDPDSRTLVRERIRVDSEEVPLVEVRILKLDGTPVDVEATASPFLDQGVRAIQVLLSDITDRKRAERELAESEARFRALAQSSPLAIIVVRKNKRQDEVLLVNAACVSLFRASSPDELVGRPALDLFRPGSKASVREAIDAATREVVPFLEAQVLRLDGTYGDVDISAAPLADGGLPATQVVMRDITERKQADEALARTEEELRFRNAILSTQLESSRDGILVVDQAGRILSHNRRFDDLWHIPDGLLEDGVDEPVLQFVADQMADQQSFLELVRYLYDYPQETSSDDLQLSDGRTFERYSAPMSGPDEHYYGRVWYFHDITERKRTEERIHEDEAELTEAQRIGQVGSFDWDARADVTTRSDEFLRVFGFERERVSPGYEANLTAYSPQSAARLDAAVKESMRTGESFVLDLEHVLPDGTPRWITARGEVKRDDDGRIIGMRGTAQDITDIKHSEDELARQLESIHKTLTSVIDIASNIVEERDPYTAGHQRRVSELATKIAQELGMSDTEVDDIRVAALLHDVGKVAVPAEMLSKPGRLTDPEFELIKVHAEVGAHIVASSHMEEPIEELIWQHHERQDGSGYPRGLAGEQVLKGARVIAVADVVEAMVSHRPYRPALGIDAALAEIEQGAGHVYDADAAASCVRLFRERGFEFS